MTQKGIAIQWFIGTEIIKADFDDLDALTQIEQTTEWWEKEKFEAKYRVDSPTLIPQDDGSYQLILEYSKANNPDLVNSDVRWGKAIISFTPGELSGDAEWQDDDDNECSGVAVWKRLDGPLIGKKRTYKTTKLARDQALFRTLLLGEDKACVITGESTQAALDAAHIIPAAKGGMEVIGNGIILRTDLHRLYDAGVFEINKDGTLTVLEKKGLSRVYKDLLATKKIKQQVISRINEALDIK